MTIITPCSRPNNLLKLKESISFDKINKWIICYDTSYNRTYTHIFKDPKIIEIEATGPKNSCYGNHQRNVAIKLVQNDYIYLLDDDNIMHPNFWNIKKEKTNDPSSLIYTFDSQRKNGTTWTRGSNPRFGLIDTACFCVHTDIIKEVTWKADLYAADGLFIETLVAKNKNQFTYIPQIAAYYNFLSVLN